MTNYNESTITHEIIGGNKWTRAYRTTIENKYNETPVIVFSEEELTELTTGEVIHGNVSSVSDVFDPAKLVQLRNPLTGELLGTTASYQDIYVIMHSLYIQLAEARDLG